MHEPAPNASCYRLRRCLARGGVAEVWLAIMVCPGNVEKSVVIKRIGGQYATDPTHVRSFLVEAWIAARMNHQNIVQLYDVGRDGDGYFAVMEHVDGCDVLQLLAAGNRIPIEHAVQIAIEVAAALEYVQDAVDGDGQPLFLVHRDISPSNIMVTRYGGVKLLDFGVAKGAVASEQTQVGIIKGKSAYMSPEQCIGAALDGRSDLFSLGAVLYELTTGVPPFSRAHDGDQTIMEKIMAGRCRLPSAHVADYPAELETIVMRALSPAPELRYQSARDFGRALATFAHRAHLMRSPQQLGDLVRRVLGGPDGTRAANKQAGGSWHDEDATVVTTVTQPEVTFGAVTTVEPVGQDPFTLDESTGS